MGGLDGIMDSMDMSLSELQEMVMDRWFFLKWLDGITDSMDVFEQTLGDSEAKPGLL